MPASNLFCWASESHWLWSVDNWGNLSTNSSNNSSHCDSSSSSSAVNTESSGGTGAGEM